MSSVDFRKADWILRQALDLDESERAGFLKSSCGDDAALQELVRRLLAQTTGSDDQLTPGAGLRVLGVETSDFAPRQAIQLNPGDRVGNFRIVHELGHGGMATVYLAERADSTFEQRVALKILDRSGESVARFEQERQILATLDNPNIARLVTGGVTDSGAPWVAMEFVDGEPLLDYCDNSHLSVEQRLRLFRRIVDAVHDAHRKLIVHRDIKSANILVTAEGTPKLLDFGIAKLLQADAMPHAAPETRAATPMTPEYASPEQIRGETMSIATDIYQLGYLLYTLLTGRSPYEVATHDLAALVNAITTTPATLPSRRVTQNRLVKQLHGDLDQVVLKALHKDPDQRYASAAEFARDIDNVLNHRPVSAQADSMSYRTRMFVRRHRWGVAAGAAFAMVVVGFGAAYAIQSARSAERVAAERDIARRESATAERVAGFLASLLENAKPDRTKGEDVTVLQLLAEGAERVDYELADEPEVQARMLGVIADSYFELGDYETALQFSRKQLDIQLTIWPQKDARLGETLRRIGEHQYFAGKLAEAQASLEQALTLHEPYAAGAAERGRTLSSLGIVLRARGDLEGARRAHEESLPLVEQLSDRDYIRRAWTNYGNVLLVTSAYDDAANAYQRALDYQDDLETTRAAGLMANLGMATAAANRPAEGLEYFERATRVFEKLLPPDHPSLGKLHSATAECLVMLRRYDDAFDLQLRALGIYERALGKDHFEINFSLIEIGDILLYTGKPAAAEPYYRRAIDVVSAAADADNVNASYAMRKLGVARLRIGDPAEAESWLQKALAIQQTALGEENMRTNLTRAQLGLAQVRLGRLDDAQQLLDKALQIQRAGPEGAHESDLAAIESIYAEYLIARKRPREAESLLLSAYRTAESHADRAGVLVTLQRLEHLYAQLEQSADAARYGTLASTLRAELNQLQIEGQ